MVENGEEMWQVENAFYSAQARWKIPNIIITQVLTVLYTCDTEHQHYFVCSLSIWRPSPSAGNDLPLIKKKKSYSRLFYLNFVSSIDTAANPSQVYRSFKANWTIKHVKLNTWRPHSNNNFYEQKVAESFQKKITKIAYTEKLFKK